MLLLKMPRKRQSNLFVCFNKLIYFRLLTHSLFEGKVSKISHSQELVLTQYLYINLNKQQLITANNYNFLKIQFNKNWGRVIYFDIRDISIIPEQCERNDNGAIFLRTTYLLINFNIHVELRDRIF